MTLRSLHNKASVLKARLQFADAMPLFEKTLASRRRVLGPDQQSSKQ
jgi:hypothetical protein